MTVSSSNICAPDFPAHPHDGYQINQPCEGGYAVWTYNATLNQWSSHIYTGQSLQFIYSDQVLTRSPDGSKQGGIETQSDVNAEYDALEQQVVSLTQQVNALETAAAADPERPLLDALEKKIAGLEQQVINMAVQLNEQA